MKANFIALKFTIILLYLINFNFLYADDDFENKYHTTVILKSGVAFYSSGTTFFDIYKNILGGTKTSYEIAPYFGLDIRVQFHKLWRLALNTDLTFTNIRDSYYQEFQFFSSKSSRYISQDINIKSIPVTLILEYTPFWLSQFKTYFGIGTGVNIIHIIWNENINSSIIYDLRKTGNKYNKINLHPVINIYGAVDLGFDKKTLENFIAGITLKLSYTNIFSKIDMFEKIRNEFENVNEKLYQEVLPYEGFIALTLSLNFNFKQKQKK